MYFARIEDAKEITKVSFESFNEISEHEATRVREIHGDFIKKYLSHFEPNNATTMKFTVPGLAYYRWLSCCKEFVNTYRCTTRNSNN